MWYDSASCASICVCGRSNTFDHKLMWYDSASCGLNCVCGGLCLSVCAGLFIITEVTWPLHVKSRDHTCESRNHYVWSQVVTICESRDYYMWSHVIIHVKSRDHYVWITCPCKIQQFCGLCLWKECGYRNALVCVCVCDLYSITS
jgi:hypothetical protein